MKQDYNTISVVQAIKLGCTRGVSNYFALGPVIWQWLRRFGNK